MPPLLLELGRKGRKCEIVSEQYLHQKKLNDLIPSKFIRKQKARLPQLSEPEVIRHFNSLSIFNHHIDKGFYPLGSCTMKYNPKINETLSNLVGLIDLHPLQNAEHSQIALEIP